MVWWLLAVLFGVLVLWRVAVGVAAVGVARAVLGVQLPTRLAVAAAGTAAVASFLPLGLFIRLGARYLSPRRVQEWRNLVNASAYDLVTEMLAEDTSDRPTLVPTAA